MEVYKQVSSYGGWVGGWEGGVWGEGIFMTLINQIIWRQGALLSLCGDKVPYYLSVDINALVQMQPVEKIVC